MEGLHLETFSCELCELIYFSQIVKRRSRSRSGKGLGPELYNKFGFHQPPTAHKHFSWLLRGQMDLGLVGMT